MQAKELKLYLAQDPMRIRRVLESAGFHDFRQWPEEIRCALPEGQNPTGVMVKVNETLYTSLFEIGYSGDLFGAMEKVMAVSFMDVITYIHNILGLSQAVSHARMVDPLKTLRSFDHGAVGGNRGNNQLYDRSVLNKFITGMPKVFLEQGISPSVAREYGIGYDPALDRIVFPHFDWRIPDKVVGIKGRANMSAIELELTGTPKYWNYIKGYQKAKNLYGYGQVKLHIVKKGHVVLFEGEKSVLRESTFCSGKGSSVALGGHAVSNDQVEFLLHELPIDCEVILAFDKDVMTKPEEGRDYIEKQARRFAGFRKISYIYDSHNLLGEKDAPVDKGLKVWNYLMKWRTTVA